MKRFLYVPMFTILVFASFVYSGNLSLDQVCSDRFGIYRELLSGGEQGHFILLDDGLETDAQICFLIKNLESNTKYYLVVKSVVVDYPDESENFLVDSLVTDNLGEAEYTWVPDGEGPTGIGYAVILDALEEGTEQTNRLEGTIDRSVFDLTTQFSDIDVDTVRVFYQVQAFENHEKEAEADSVAELIKDLGIEIIEFDFDSTAMFNYLANDDTLVYPDHERMYITLNDGQNEYFLDGLQNKFQRKIKVTHLNMAPEKADSASYYRYSTGEDVFRSILAHELTHWIIYAYTNNSCIGWINEGQANAILTLHNPTEELTVDIIDSARQPKKYMKDLEDYTQFYSSGYLEYLSNPKFAVSGSLGYGLALYWRFLYENYTSGSIEDRTKIWALVDDLYDNEDILGSVDTALDSLDGSYSSFRESWEEFAQALCFIQAEFDSGTAYLPTRIYPPDENRITDEYLGPASGPVVLNTDNIDAIGGINFLQFTFAESVDTAMVTFDGKITTACGDWTVFAYLGQSGEWDELEVDLNANQKDTLYIGPDDDDTLKVIPIMFHEDNDCNRYKLTIEEP